MVAAPGPLCELDRNTLYRHKVFHWDAIEHITAPNGAKMYSVRLSQRIRALALRDGGFLRLIWPYPKHDSAYQT